MPWSFMGHRPQTPWTDTELETVLRAICQGVIRVILLGNLDEPVTLLSMLADMRPRHAYLLVDTLSPQLDFTLPFFRQVSHMLIADLNTPESSTGGWRHTVSRLPALTHIALNLLTSPHILSGILSDCANLQAVVMYANEEMATEAKHFSVIDQRVVVLVSEDLLSNWNMTCSDIWASADSFMSRKRRGEIEESCYHLEPVEMHLSKQPVADPIAPASPTLPPPDSTSPRFDPALEQKFFEHAAILYPAMIPVFLRVARRVLEWMEPYIYKDITIATQARNSESSIALLQAAQSKPAHFFAHAVRYLRLNAASLSIGLKGFPWDTQQLKSDDGWSDAELASLLHLCTAVTHLALIGDLSNNRLLPILGRMQPANLTLAVDIVQNPPPRFNLPFFQNITHLHLFDADVNLFDADCSILRTWSYWSPISELPGLTHLAFPCQTPNSILPVLLSDLPRLNALVLLADAFVNGRWISQHLPVSDQRGVVVQTNWDLDRGNNYFWAQADTFLARKHRGEIEAWCYYVEHV
ncbi:hypothetical protein C8R47DRAFT_1121629 [Mycena vitilis]|nr:hypothetical protein C8R47DRAFT_1121629 [Mycena vitilis]